MNSNIEDTIFPHGNTVEELLPQMLNRWEQIKDAIICGGYEAVAIQENRDSQEIFLILIREIKRLKAEIVELKDVVGEMPNWWRRDMMYHGETIG